MEVDEPEFQDCVEGGYFADDSEDDEDEGEQERKRNGEK